MIDACIQLLEKYQLTAEQIAHVTVKTFHRATLLSKIVPKTVDEACENIPLRQIVDTANDTQYRK